MARNNKRIKITKPTKRLIISSPGYDIRYSPIGLTPCTWLAAGIENEPLGIVVPCKEISAVEDCLVPDIDDTTWYS